MNEVICKRMAIFSLILGAVIGIASCVPFLVSFGLFTLMFLSSPVVILYMKNNEKLGILNNEQGAIYGGIIGFCASIGFFASFSPLVCVLKLIFKKYYAYIIPDMITSALWLFFLLVFMIALIFAATNSASAMGIVWLFSRFEKKPDDESIDIEIND